MASAPMGLPSMLGGDLLTGDILSSDLVVLVPVVSVTVFPGDILVLTSVAVHMVAKVVGHVL